MKANVEEVVGVHVEEDVVAVGDVGLARILLMVRIPLVATMVSLESIKLQKMESLEGPLRGEVVDSVALVEGSVGDAEVALAMRKVPKLIALAEYMIDEVEQDTGTTLNGRELVEGTGELPQMRSHRRQRTLLMKERRLLILRNKLDQKMLEIPKRILLLLSQKRRNLRRKK